MKETLHIYVRVSSVAQLEGSSLKTQKEAGITLANKLGMKHEIHNEGGKSSSKDDLDNRPVMTNLLRLMDKGIIKHLFVWNTDRLSRNQITWYTIRQKMLKNAVVLYTPKGIHNTQDFLEDMLLGILSEISTYDNKIRSERSRIGKLEKVRANYWRGGDTPFGYKLEHDGVGNRLVADQVESKWIKFLFSEYSKGRPLKDIKLQFEKNKIKTRRGNDKWSMGSLQLILRNEVYTGIDEFFDKKSKQAVVNKVPQIISTKLFHLVKERRSKLLQQKGQLNRTKKFYLFRDFLICGGCKTNMGGRIKPNLNIYQYYCPISERNFNKAYNNDTNCKKVRCLNIQSADTILWNTIIGILSNAVLLKKELNKKTLVGKRLNSDEINSLVVEKEKRMNKLMSEKKEIEKGLVKIEAQNLLKKYSSADIYRGLKKELNDKYTKVKIAIEDLNNSLSELGDKKNWLNWIDMFTHVISNSADAKDEEKKKLLNEVLESIIVNYDKEKKLHNLRINFRLPVLFGEGDKIKKGRTKSAQNISSRSKILTSPTPVGAYSTVTDFARFLG